MTKKADIGSKRLIGLDPDRWVQWVTEIPGATAQEIISTDFQWVGREGDVLVRASSPEDGEFLVHNELQLYYNNKIPRRVRAYTALAEEKYEMPVYPVLINILKRGETPPQIPTYYESQFRNIRAYQDYRVINLWEVDAALVFQQPLPSLLPFVPILKDGGKEATVREALKLLREDEKLNELENLLAFFATFVLETEVVQQIISMYSGSASRTTPRTSRWDMAVLQQSPWYQQILQEGESRGLQIGEQRGLQIGEQRGIQIGEQRGLLSGIQMGLELKFGSSGNALIEEISAVKEIEVLSRIIEGLKTVQTLEELRKIYQRDNLT
ncbi:MAG: Rpn family recombination-promoting nuclease/putative transposase [Hormoscilla sp.]